MKPRTEVLLALMIVVGAIFWVMTSRHADLSWDPQNAGACCPVGGALQVMAPMDATGLSAPAEAGPMFAYYFHGTVRCDACLLIEALAASVIEREFGVEMAMGRLIFMSVDYDLPENAHFLSDYQLPCPSLVLVRHGHEGSEEWKLLDGVWPLVDKPLQFNDYVGAEVRVFLQGETRRRTHGAVGH